MDESFPSIRTSRTYGLGIQFSLQGVVELWQPGTPLATTRIHALDKLRSPTRPVLAVVLEQAMLIEGPAIKSLFRP